MDPIDLLWFVPPGRSCGKIADGRAAVSWNTRRTPVVEVSAPEYLPAWAHLLGKDQQTGRVEVKLCREPRPTVTLIVPRGYRGLVKLGSREAGGHEAYPAWTRQFDFKIEPYTVNFVAWSRVLSYTLATDYLAAYDDGTPIPSGRGASPEHVAFRYVDAVTPRGSHSVRLFCVGTAAEAQEWRAQVIRQTSWYGPAVDMAWVEQLGTANGSTNLHGPADDELGNPRPRPN